MAKPKISKSQYMYASQCPLRLWYYRNKKELTPEVDSATQAIFDQGHVVGELAMTYFRGGVEVTAEHYELEVALTQTNEFIEAGKSVIYEAFACSNDGMYSRIDILRKVRGKDEWDLIEVKSSTKVKEQFLVDMATQRYAFEGAGYKIRKSQLMFINNKYVRDGELDVKRLFSIEDCTEEVIERMADVKGNLKTFKRILEDKEEPEVEVGDHCSKPYDCPYIDHCWRDEPDEDFGEDKLVVDKPFLKDFVDQLEYPLFYLDYETINCAIPPFDGMRPYQQYTFQYSLHIQREKGGEVEHVEYLHSEASDPRGPLIKKLVKDCEKSGTVIAYSISFEASRNKELARDFPEYSKELLAINERLVDLAVPFRKKALWYPSWGRGYSIKLALPAFVPDLSYKDLNIQGGGDASTIFLDIIFDKASPEEKNQILNDLKAYCGLDTLAMVKLLEVIYKSI